MRICCVANADIIHTQRWVNYLAAKGHEVHLITWQKCPGYARDVQFHLLPVLAPRIWALSRYFNYVIWVVTVRRRLRSIQPDVLVAHWITVRGYLTALSGFHPMVLIPWGSDILLHPRKNRVWKGLTQYALKKADMVIPCSEVLRSELLKLGTEPGKIRIANNGVDTKKFHPKRRDERLREQLGLGESPTVISIRHLTPLYDVPTLLRAVPLVLSQVPETRFIIGSDGEQREHLVSLADSLGISPSVRFVGQIPHQEVPRYLASSEVYVSTALSDSLGVSTLEAKACGLPTVVTDLPASREWTVDGEDGFIVPARSPQMLSERIVRLLQDQVLRSKFGEAGRKMVEKRAEFEKEMGKMEQLLLETISHH